MGIVLALLAVFGFNSVIDLSGKLAIPAIVSNSWRIGVICYHHSEQTAEILPVEEEKISMKKKQSENYLDKKPLLK